jgi:aryl-alcohol dehydrogenase-like predicted oxidoreductase
LSNFTASEVQEAYDYSKSKGYILPTVYQANYNLVARKNETLLFPTLRKLGISIQAYSPIAGGFLVKTPEQITSPTSERWTAGNTIGDLYRGLYFKPEMLDFLQKFGELSEKSGVSSVGLAYRWVRYHSVLKADDTLIFGASSVKQIEETLKVVEEGPLEAWVAERLDDLWKGVAEVAPVDSYSLIRQAQ